MTLNPKYATHYFHAAEDLKGLPHVVNVYLDYNCPFSGIFYNKFYEEVIPKVEKAHPGRFQYVYINVVQPWHPNLVFLNEFSLAYAKLLREQGVKDANKKFWEFNNVVYTHKKAFYDTVVVKLSRNEIYARIYDEVAKHYDFPIKRDELLHSLNVPEKQEDPNNDGNAATADIKYFTKFLRTGNVHVTPTIQVEGVSVPGIESLTPLGEVADKLISHL